MDIKSAYLNGVVVEEIYMHQPKGYEELGKEHLLAKLRKGLYGLKQAGHEWYATLHKFLISCQESRSKSSDSPPIGIRGGNRGRSVPTGVRMTVYEDRGLGTRRCPTGVG